VQIVEADIMDDATLSGLLQRADSVINLVGVLHSQQSRAGSKWGRDFERAHVELTRKLVRSCRTQNVRRCIHMSALGVGLNAPSMYLRSKAAAEKIMLEAQFLDVTVMRPSVVFGEEDKFLNLFAQLQKFMPVLALGGTEAKFQPVYVKDVARAFVSVLDNQQTYGKIYDLVGSHVYTLRELINLVGTYSGHMRPLIGLPHFLAKLQAWMLEYVPGGPLMSRDNVDSMKVDNVAGPRSQLPPDWQATPLEAVAPHYLARD
jgi:NADH dehydrogenase